MYSSARVAGIVTDIITVKFTFTEEGLPGVTCLALEGRRAMAGMQDGRVLEWDVLTGDIREALRL
jgi:hypothetical protein